MPYPPIEKFVPPDVPLYLTPDGIPVGRFCRTISVPFDEDNRQWLALVDGILSALTDPAVWRTYGMLTPEEAASAWQDMLIASWLIFGCSTEDIAPYWENESDIEGTVPEGESQRWYGVFDGLTFQESLENVVIAAYVGMLGGIGAAVEFLFIARKFRLQFETDPLGGIIDIFVNSERYRTVDTYSPTPDIISVDIIADAGGFSLLSDEPDTLLIVLVGKSWEGDEEPTMHVVRKQLVGSEVQPSNFRYDPDTDEAQTTTDDGETWHANPGIDPRHNPAYALPPRGTGDVRCDAAANMVEALRFTLNVIADAGTTLSRVNTLLGYIQRFMPEITFIIEIIGYAVQFLAVYAEVIEANMTDEVYDALECDLYCGLEDDGSCTAGDLEDILADFFDQYPEVPFTLVQFVFQTWWGEVGLTNAGAIGTETGDCDECECCISTFTTSYATAWAGWEFGAYGEYYADVLRGTARGYVDPIGYTWENDGTVTLPEEINITTVTIVVEDDGVANAVGVFDMDDNPLGSMSVGTGTTTAVIELAAPYFSDQIKVRSQATNTFNGFKNTWIRSITVDGEC